MIGVQMVNGDIRQVWADWSVWQPVYDGYRMIGLRQRYQPLKAIWFNLA